ncbi:glutathione peroxidase [soil metagenome]
MGDRSAYDFQFRSLDGAAMPLGDFEGRVLLIVNTASRCGFTRQYAALETLSREREVQGLTVIGIPCNDFGGQEPGAEPEIGDFCRSEYRVTFPLTSKAHVRGSEIAPFYRWAGGQAGFLGRPLWNFHKYLIGRDGRFITWFSSLTKPESAKIARALDHALAGPRAGEGTILAL